jgi:hypothetical protein
MPRFPNFRRKSSAAEDQNGSIAEPSFRVLERTDASGGGKSFDGGARMARSTTYAPKTGATDAADDDNIFAGLATNNR